MKDRMKTLKILNCLMREKNGLTTKELMKRCDCNIDTVYRVVDILEINGFGIEVDKKCNFPSNTYKFNGVFDFNEVY